MVHLGKQTRKLQIAHDCIRGIRIIIIIIIMGKKVFA